MATPLYKFLKEKGYSTYVFPGAKNHISSAYQNDNLEFNFSKFMLLDIDFTKTDFLDPDKFNTESLNTITDKNEILVSSLRNYVANHDVTVMETQLGNGQTFFNPDEPLSVTERVFWKWLRKSGGVEFEPAIPNDEYIDSSELAVDENLDEDYFKEYLWKERESIPFSVTSINDEGVEIPDPKDGGIIKKLYTVTLSSDSNIKPNDTVVIKNNGNININIGKEKSFTVYNITSDETLTEGVKNNVIGILSDVSISWNNAAVCSLGLEYDKTIHYIGEIQATDNVQAASHSYTSVIASIPDQNGQTPDILFRIKSDSNYSPSLQYPILPTQDQPEIIGGEQIESPIVKNPEEFPGDQYAFFDVDQKYTNSDGLKDRKSGDYYGLFENTRNSERLSSAPYVYPEFNGNNLDGLTVDFDSNHYVKMNLSNKTSRNFDEFNAQYFNSQAPKDFNFNVILWYYTIEDKSTYQSNVDESTETTTETTETATVNTTVITREETIPNEKTGPVSNLYAITFLNPIKDGVMETYPKYVANSEQDGLSYQFGLNIDFLISNDNQPEQFDENKTYGLFSFDLYNEAMRQLTKANDAFLKVIEQNIDVQQQVNNLKSLLYAQTDIRDINSRIESLYKLLNQYKTSQITSSDSIEVKTDESSNPPKIKLYSTETGLGKSLKIKTSTMYNNSSSTVIDKNITIPQGRDFLITLYNDDNVNNTLNRNLSIVFDKDFSHRQSCKVRIIADNTLYNKKLDLSIKTNHENYQDNDRGYVFAEGIDLPIDNNISDSENIDGINKRWEDKTSLPINKLFIKKNASEYYIACETNPLYSNSMKNGDVLYLGNMNFSYTNPSSGDTVSINASGQYNILGDTVDNIIVFRTEISELAQMFNALAVQNSNLGSGLQEIKPSNINSLPVIRPNYGWEITITANGDYGNKFNDYYFVDIKKL